MLGIGPPTEMDDILSSSSIDVAGFEDDPETLKDRDTEDQGPKDTQPTVRDLDIGRDEHGPEEQKSAKGPIHHAGIKFGHVAKDDGCNE